MVIRDKRIMRRPRIFGSEYHINPYNELLKTVNHMYFVRTG